MALHEGAISPITSGWDEFGGKVDYSFDTLDYGGEGVLELSDPSTAAGSTRGYLYIPNAEEIALGEAYGWKYTARILMPDEDDAPDGSVHAEYSDGSRRWSLNFGSNDVFADPIVRPAAEGAIVVEGGRGLFHDYSLYKPPGIANAEFSINGQSRHSSVAPQNIALQRFMFGANSSADTGRALYSRISLEIFPPLNTYLLENYELDGDAVEGISSNTNESENVSATADRNGTSGAALLFAGDESRVVLSDSAFDPEDGFTIAAWIRPDNQEPGARRRIVSNWDGAYTGTKTGTVILETHTSLEDGKTRVRFTIWDSNESGRSLVSDETVPIGAWTHVAARMVHGHMALFVNGKASGRLDIPSYEKLNTAYNWGIGCDGSDVEDPEGGFVGAIDDVQLYTEALSDSEIHEVIEQKALRWTESSIADGAKDIDPAASVTLTFSEALDAATLGSAAVSLLGSRSGVIPFNLVDTGNAIELTPSAPFEEGEIVELRVNESLGSQSGSHAVSRKIQFRTTLPEREELYARETKSRGLSNAGLFVDAATGAFSQELNLLTVESVRPINVTLRYNSLLDREKSSVGYGWTHAYLAHLEEAEDGTVTVYYDSSRHNVFTESDEEPGRYRSEDRTARFDSILRKPFGRFRQNDNWVVGRKDGTTYVFGARGNLLGIANRIGQYILVEYEATRPVAIYDYYSNRKIFLNYDSKTGLLDFVSDLDTEIFTAFRQVYLEYDEHGRLIASHDPVDAGMRQVIPSMSPQAIPDNDTGGLVVDTEIEDDLFVGVTILDFSIKHRRHEDLEVFLESPAGTEIRVFNRDFGTGDVKGPSQVRYFDFNGENAKGIWRLKVYDRRSGEFGTLSRWELIFSGPSNPVNLSYSDPVLSPSGSSRIVEATDALGERFFSVDYDEQRRVIGQDDGLDSSPKTRFEYDWTDSNRYRTFYYDRLGNRWTMEHDRDLQLLSSQNPLGGTARWDYDENGLCVSTQDPLGRETVFAYDESGLVASATDPAGYATTFEYSGGHVQAIEDAKGQRTEFFYSGGSLMTVTDSLGFFTRRVFSESGELLEIKLEDGGEVDYTWENGLLRSARHAQIVGLNSDLSHDPAGRPLILTDGEGNQTRISYLPNGDVVERIDSQGNSTHKEYDHRSRLVEDENKKGFSYKFEYDANDNRTRVIDPIGRESLYFYDAESRLVRQVDTGGLETLYEYNAAGSLVSVTGPTGVRRSYNYDLAGNKVLTLGHEGNIVERLTYDERNLVIAKTDAYGNETQFGYDELGRLITATDAQGRKTQFAFDELDRLVAVTDSQGRIFRKTYYDDDLPKDLTQPDGISVTLSYDQANRPTGERAHFYSPPGDRYDNRDLLVRDNLPGGGYLDIQYDQIGRITQILEVTSGGDTARSVQYAYDANDNINRMIDFAPTSGVSNATSTRTYDDLDRITSYIDESGNGIGYAYHPSGKLRRLTYPDGKTVDYFYGSSNRLETVVDWADRETHYAYNSLSLVESIIFPNGAYRLMEYDEVGRITSRTDYSRDDTVIVQYSYTYDERQNIMVESTGHDVPVFQPPSVEMTYRDGDRLDTFNGLQVEINTAGDMIRGPLKGVLEDFEYDLRGRMLKAGSVDYHYSVEDRLSGWNVEGDETRFVNNPVSTQTQLLLKRDPDAATTRYVHGLGIIYEDTPDGLRIYHYDERGSVIAYSDESGSVVGRVGYGPYGEIYHTEGWTDSLFKFNGLFGIVTGPQGLNYMRYRWYSPEIKRFTRLDSQLGEIASIGSLNRYAFATGNPANRVDPSGEIAQIFGGAVAGAIFGVGSTFVVDFLDDGKFNTAGEDYAAAAIGGAVAGALVAACPTCGIAYAGFVGAAEGAISNATAAGFKGEAVDFESLAADAAFGAAFGAATYSPDPPGGTPKRAIDRFIEEFKDASPDSRNFFTGVGVQLLRDSIKIDLYHPDTETLSGGSESGGNIATGNIDTVNRARYAPAVGHERIYGEFNHWRIFTAFLRLAQEPVPFETERQINSF